MHNTQRSAVASCLPCSSVPSKRTARHAAWLYARVERSASSCSRVQHLAGRRAARGGRGSAASGPRRATRCSWGRKTRRCLRERRPTFRLSQRRGCSTFACQALICAAALSRVKCAGLDAGSLPPESVMLFWPLKQKHERLLHLGRAVLTSECGAAVHSKSAPSVRDEPQAPTPDRAPTLTQIRIQTWNHRRPPVTEPEG